MRDAIRSAAQPRALTRADLAYGGTIFGGMIDLTDATGLAVADVSVADSCQAGAPGWAVTGISTADGRNVTAPGPEDRALIARAGACYADRFYEVQ